MSAATSREERLCGHCRRAHPVSDHVAEESPFCTKCLKDRIAHRIAKSLDERVQAAFLSTYDKKDVSFAAKAVRSLLEDEADWLYGRRTHVSTVIAELSESARSFLDLMLGTAWRA